MIRNAVTASLLCFAVSASAGTFDGTIRAIASNSEYIQPAATLLGTMNNLGWTRSSHVSKGFAFSFSIPISLVQIDAADRSYSAVYSDSSIIKSSHAKTSAIYKDYAEQPYTAPTIFGTMKAPTLKRAVLGTDGTVASSMPVLLSDGMSQLAKVSWIPVRKIRRIHSRCRASA